MEEILTSDDPAEYLEKIGYKIQRLEDGLVKIRTNAFTEDGRIHIVVRIDDIPDLIGDTYNALYPIEDVFDKYVVKRTIE